MYEAHAKRVAANRVHSLKTAMISGAWANSNYDDDQKTRENLLVQIDEFVDQAIRNIYGLANPVDDIDRDNPFFSAMKVPSIDPHVDSESLGELSE